MPVSPLPFSGQTPVRLCNGPQTEAYGHGRMKKMQARIQRMTKMFQRMNSSTNSCTNSSTNSSTKSSMNSSMNSACIFRTFKNVENIVLFGRMNFLRLPANIFFMRWIWAETFFSCARFGQTSFSCTGFWPHFFSCAHGHRPLPVGMATGLGHWP